MSAGFVLWSRLLVPPSAAACVAGLSMSSMASSSAPVWLSTSRSASAAVARSTIFAPLCALAVVVGFCYASDCH